MRFSKPIWATLLAAGLAIAPWVCLAASPDKLTGSIVGFVSNGSGVAQMGATVLLFDRYERLIRKTLTNERGAFGFDALLPDAYSLRVTLPSFVPALKHNIVVQPGMRSFLSINLASLLSSIELIYAAPGQEALMNDDWKWVLRSAAVTRPVLRFHSVVDVSEPGSARRIPASFFSRTRGVVKLSAGEDSANSTLGEAPDLGTAFALATSLFGGSRIQFSGNLGYSSQLGVPSAAFSTRYSAGEGAFMPDVQLTMRQVFLPARAGAAFLGGQQTAPVLRSMAAAFQDRFQLGENALLELGSSLESVSFLERLNYLSPYARLTYTLGEGSFLALGFSSGLPPAPRAVNSSAAEPDLQNDLSLLALFPRVSLYNGSARVQRAENFEIGYTGRAGSRTYAFAAYRESVSNAAFLMSAPAGFLPAQDLLPDLYSDSSVFNVGRYRTLGFMASLSQSLGEAWSAMVSYAGAGALSSDGSPLGLGDAQQLRRSLRFGRVHSWAGAVSGSTPWSGTKLSAAYRWTPGGVLPTPHYFLTVQNQFDPGLNVSIRQPMPAPRGLPGRLEATAELRNLRAQGYLPLTTADGRRLVLIQAPRALRGSLSFIF